jgi:hypothetical protein
MNRFKICLLLLLAPGSLEGQETLPPRSPQQRQELWVALEKALPEEFREIDVYAENDALTRVLFRSQGKTLLFSLESGKVERVIHQKHVRRANRVTYVPGTFILWYNGRVELKVASE